MSLIIASILIGYLGGWLTASLLSVIDPGGLFLAFSGLYCFLIPSIYVLAKMSDKIDSLEKNMKEIIKKLDFIENQMVSEVDMVSREKIE